jgi:hypothetical protein
MSADREAMQRWEALSDKANEAFQGQPMEDVGGALALLTAMFLAGLAQDDWKDRSPERMAWMVAQHGKMVLDLIPAFFEVIEENGGWDEITKKGRH